MNATHRIGRLAGALAAVACALAAFAAGAPASLATTVPPAGGSAGAATPLRPLPPGWNKHPSLPLGHVTGPVLNPGRAGYPPVSHVHAVVTGGMPGWEITLIAIGAALAAAAAAVLLDRARTTRRRVSITGAPGSPAPAPACGAAAIWSPGQPVQDNEASERGESDVPVYQQPARQ